MCEESERRLKAEFNRGVRLLRAFYNEVEPRIFGGADLETEFEVLKFLSEHRPDEQ